MVAPPASSAPSCAGAVDAEREAACDRESRGGELAREGTRDLFSVRARAARADDGERREHIRKRRRARIVCATTTCAAAAAQIDPERRTWNVAERVGEIFLLSEHQPHAERLHVFIRFARVGEWRRIFGEQRRVLAEQPVCPFPTSTARGAQSFHRGVAAVRCDGDGIIIVCFGECGSHCDMGLTLADS